mgnify:FL=1
MEKDYLLTNEISDEYRVTLIYVRKVIREHKVKALKHGRDYIVRRSDWERFFLSGEV